MRAGTENVPGIVGIGRAAVCSAAILEKKMAYESRLRDYFIRRLLEEIPGSSINGDRRNRLPNNVNISIAGVNGPAVVALLDLEGICVSSASEMPDIRHMRLSVLPWVSRIHRKNWTIPLRC